MKRNFFQLFGTFLISLLFLLVIPLSNHAFASPAGSSCIQANGVPNGGCDSNLYCDTSASTGCSGGGCQGTCRATCGIYAGGPANGGCQAGEFCQIDNYTPGFGGSGHCISDASAHVDVGLTCKTTSSNDKQGNCVAGTVCNTANDQSCSGKPVGCSGVCFPPKYQCNMSTLPNYFACPPTFTCGGYDPKCSSPSVGTAYQQTPLCQQCAPNVDTNINCKCENPGVLGSGKNGYVCQSRLLPSQKSYCSTDAACNDDAASTFSRSDVFNGAPLHGVRCQDPLNETPPPPPSPPCKAWAGNGGCSLIESSIGDIQTQPGPFILRGFNILLALSGGVAVLLLMRAGYNIMMSRGNPEGLQRGREQFVATIVGLLFLIFSFVLFQTITVDILHIPGFK